MSIASKLFGIWVMGKTVNTTTPLFIRLLAGMAAVAFCAIVATAIVVMLIMGAVWLVYAQFTANGLDSHTSALVVGGLLLALLASIVGVTRNYLHQLEISGKKLLNLQAPIGGRISRVLDAFMEGVKHPQASK